MNRCHSKILRNLALLAMFTTCRAPQPELAQSPRMAGKNTEGDSDFTQSLRLRFQLPGSDSLRSAKSGTSNSPINFWRITSSGKCLAKDAEKHEDIYTDSVISVPVKADCPFTVELSLGRKRPGSADIMYYTTYQPISVSTADASASGIIPIQFQLKATSEGTSEGLPASVATREVSIPDDQDNARPLPPAQQQNNSTPPKPPQQNPPTTPPPGNSLPALPSSLQVSMTQANGQSVSLSSVFTTKYLLVDFSQPGCGPCISHAEEANQDSATQRRYSGSGACKSIIIVSTTQLSDWLDGIGGASTFSGKNSYGFKTGINGFSNLFGNGYIRSTPTFILVDRSGRVVGDASDASSMCR